MASGRQCRQRATKPSHRWDAVNASLQARAPRPCGACPPVAAVVNMNAMIRAVIAVRSKQPESVMASNIVHVTDASFEQEVLKSQLPVLVDYWAEWCGPCKMIAPVLDEIARDYADRVKVCKMDVDANREIPLRYAVRGIPTLMVFVNGDVAATKVGAVSRSQLASFLDGAIA